MEIANKILFILIVIGLTVFLGIWWNWRRNVRKRWKHEYSQGAYEPTPTPDEAIEHTRVQDMSPKQREAWANREAYRRMKSEYDRNTKAGLTLYQINGVYIWALNDKSADKKAKKMGLYGNS